jgi:hypothetical protein
MAEDSKTGRLRGTEASPKFFWTIHVSMDGVKFEQRDVIQGPVAIGAVFQAASNYCRDEGWNHMHISRLRNR